MVVIPRSCFSLDLSGYRVGKISEGISRLVIYCKGHLKNGEPEVILYSWEVRHQRSRTSLILSRKRGALDISKDICVLLLCLFWSMHYWAAHSLSLLQMWFSSFDPSCLFLLTSLPHGFFCFMASAASWFLPFAFLFCWWPSLISCVLTPWEEDACSLVRLSCHWWYEKYPLGSILMLIVWEQGWWLFLH